VDLPLGNFVGFLDAPSEVFDISAKVTAPEGDSLYTTICEDPFFLGEITRKEWIDLLLEKRDISHFMFHKVAAAVAHRRRMHEWEAFEKEFHCLMRYSRKVEFEYEI
jgi:hypothetical protein